MRKPQYGRTADAHATLLMHRWDPDTRRCAGCSASCPCPEAQAAAQVLARAGEWNTMPFTGPAGPWTGRDLPGRDEVRAGGGRWVVLARRLWSAAVAR